MYLDELGGICLKAIQGQQIVRRTRTKPHPQTKIYMGNKVSGNLSVQAGGSYKKRKFGENGCGCGKNPKKIDR